MGHGRMVECGRRAPSGNGVMRTGPSRVTCTGSELNVEWLKAERIAGMGKFEPTNLHAGV